MKQGFYRQSVMAVPFLLGLFFFAGLVIAIAGGINPNGTTFFAVNTDNQLVRFNAVTPGTMITIGTITGLQTGEDILAIDSRPATGQLYGLGSSSRIYIINKTTAAATAVGGQFSTLLNGANFGFDFNPTVDRIRVVSDAGQNLRINPNTGAVTVDGPLNPGTPQVTAAAYTNSFGVATSTTLYDIDTNTDRLLIQSNPNAGTLTDVGPLGVDFQPVNGFDIATVSNGTTTTNTAYAVSSGAFTNPILYTINLQTGAATLVGNIGDGSNFAAFRGLAAQAPGASPALNLLDFDGDRRADYSVFRQSINSIFISRPTGNPSTSFFGFQFGQNDDIFTPGDYDFDGRTDVAVFRRSTGVFYVLQSSTNTVVGTQFGAPSDEPVARDYDGDGRTDFAVVRRANGVITWFILNSSTNTATGTVFGAATDRIAPGDYDGDGKFDLAVFRGMGDQPATFYVQLSSGGFIAQPFGIGSDLVVPGDYDGDGRTDFAVVRTGTNFQWYILRSSNNSLQFDQLGTPSFLTVQNDYDGDGKTDVAVYNPSNGFFYVRRSSDGVLAQVQFGQGGDLPIANYDTH